MNRKKQKTEKQQNEKLFRLDATFYYHKAVQALDRQDYHKALRYFERAMEIEPYNPINHCNVAGILSELGLFEESNEILKRVLDEIEPHFFECYFYMATNYANLEDYETAEEYALRYLECEPGGVYHQDTVELLEFISGELGRPSKRVSSLEESQPLREHEKARKLLEEGKFMEASRLLKRMIEQYPDFLAARNNLSLTYYYMGQFDKAHQEAIRVLEIDKNNLHALCNLAVFYNHMGRKAEMFRLLSGLKKIYPMHSEQIYKLATTMGILGEHETAYRLFLTLYMHHGIANLSLLHQIAVAAYNQGNLQEAERWWKKLSHFPDGKETGECYLRMIASGDRPIELGYQYPGEGAKQGDRSRDPQLRSSFFWALANGDDALKKQVILTMAEIGDTEVMEMLAQLLRSPKESMDLKKLALKVLQEIGAPLPQYIYAHGRMIALYHYIENLKALDLLLDLYTKVLDTLQENWQQDEEIYLIDAEQMLMELLVHDLEKLSSLRKKEGIAAAIEYWVMNEVRDVSKTEIASRYRISPATLSKYLATLTGI